MEAHVTTNDNSAVFSETQYCEVVVGDFLYDLITSNIDVFNDVASLRKTTMFFHHYKIQMGNIKARMVAAGQPRASLTLGTYNNLKHDLDEAITELRGHAGT